jgi:hypothetical protein
MASFLVLGLTKVVILPRTRPLFSTEILRIWSGAQVFNLPHNRSTKFQSPALHKTAPDAAPKHRHRLPHPQMLFLQRPNIEHVRLFHSFLELGQEFANVIHLGSQPDHPFLDFNRRIPTLRGGWAIFDHLCCSYFATSESNRLRHPGETQRF